MPRRLRKRLMPELDRIPNLAPLGGRPVNGQRGWGLCYVDCKPDPPPGRPVQRRQRALPDFRHAGIEYPAVAELVDGAVPCICRGEIRTRPLYGQNL